MNKGKDHGDTAGKDVSKNEEAMDVESKPWIEKMKKRKDANKKIVRKNEKVAEDKVKDVIS